MKVTIHQTTSRSKFPFNSLSLLIKYFSKTDYSHYAMSYESESGNTVFCDSTSKGVRQMAQEQFDKHNIIKRSFVCDVDIPREYFLRWFERHQGKDYGFKQIVGLALKIFHIVKHNPFGKGAKRIICNELVVLFINRFYHTGVVDTDSLNLKDTEQLIYKAVI